MPGRTIPEAIGAFTAPLQQAVSCLGIAKLTISSQIGAVRMDQAMSWGINNGGGMELRSASGRLEFYASMFWKVIADPDNGPFRVTTTGYDYQLLRDDRELWDFHWNTGEKSKVKTPHLHLGDVVLSTAAPVTSKAHLPTGRVTLEQAVRWAVEFGAQPKFSDWEDRLALAEAPHLLFRSWNTEPTQ